MLTKGFFISRTEIKNEIIQNLKSENSWQKRYCEAASTEGREKETAIAKARAIRSGHRAQAIMDFLATACNVEITEKRDYDYSEHFHPKTTVQIMWGPDETETIEIEQ